jgi:uncharacterized damage-inducible protein DinB
MPEKWKEIVASALDWEQAHAGLDRVTAGLAPELRGKRPNGMPHSPWELLEHIRRTQHDLLEFCVNEQYEELTWPDDYWPSSPAPESEQAWDDCVAAIHDDAHALARFTTEGDRDLTARIPHGTGQTYLRTVLVAIDHTSHHLGQLIDVRRLLGAWPPPE